MFGHQMPPRRRFDVLLGIYYTVVRTEVLVHGGYLPSLVQASIHRSRPQGAASVLPWPRPAMCCAVLYRYRHRIRQHELRSHPTVSSVWAESEYLQPALSAVAVLVPECTSRYSYLAHSMV